MPLTVIPYIPRTITVHMGPPGQWAENVTVSFPDYVKNVASSEIYPTWEPAAIRANVLAIVSFALNRVYTEYYPSRGYDFQITSTTAYDQKFIKGRSIFESISQVVDELFDDYIRRQGHVEPLSAKFCNGTTTTCDGLSQWGSQRLAQEGLDSMAILHRYYGNDIELVTNAPIQGLSPSAPTEPLRLGSAEPAVSVVQSSLNRISQNYPAIPKISAVSGAFNQQTEDAVKAFQRIFNLTPDGVVGRSTWYKIVSLYVGVTQLAELESQGQQFYGIQFQFPGVLREGDSGPEVRVLQYMLDFVAEFDDGLGSVTVDGSYGPATTQAVRNYQHVAGLSADGVAGQATWNSLYARYAAADRQLRRVLNQNSGGDTSAARLGQNPGYDLQTGQSDQREG